MAKRKRDPANTAESAVKAMVDAALGLPNLPKFAYLRSGDRPFWEGVVSVKAREEWDDTSLVVAAQLARVQADIEAESKLLEDEYRVAEAPLGKGLPNTLIVNPRVGLIESLTRREMAMMRSLGIAGSASARPRNEIVRRVAAKAAREVREEVTDDDDGLLAR